MKVFISHSSADKAAVKRISDQLTKAKIDTWSIESNLKPGANWQAEIESALHDATHCVFVLSASSLKSPAVMKEWQYFLIQNKRLLIAQVEAIEPEAIPWRLASFTRIDLTHDFTKGMRSLIEAIRSEDTLITERSISESRRLEHSRASVTLEFDLKELDTQKLVDLITELADKGIEDIRVVQVGQG
jgi:TIR domain